MLRLFVPFSVILAAAFAPADTPPARTGAVEKKPVIIGEDKPVFLGSMTVVATPLPPE